MNAYLPRPNAIPWPPIIYASAVLVAILLGHLHHLGMSAIPALMRMPLGAVLFAGGLGLDIWAMKTLHDARTTILPHRASSHLAVGGPFRFSRNPIYLGNTLALIGIGVASGHAWFVVTALVAALATQKLAIEREELHLLALFGAEYEAYCRRTRRWI